MQTKVCTECLQDKTLDAYRVEKKGKYGRGSKCRECVRKKYLERTGRVEVVHNRTFTHNGAPHKKCKVCKEVKHVRKFYTKTWSSKYSTCSTCRYFEKASARKTDGVIYRVCTHCSSEKPLSEFSKHSGGKGLFGKSGTCLICRRNQYKSYRQSNPEKARVASALWREKHPDKQREAKRRWYENNRDKEIAGQQRRRARLRRVNSTLTGSEWEGTLERFDWKCALSGDANYTLDHFIPISISNVGNVKENVIPLSYEINSSKWNKNPFEWAPYASIKYGFSMDKFNRVVDYLAEINAMSVLEYRDFVYAEFKGGVDKIG